MAMESDKKAEELLEVHAGVIEQGDLEAFTAQRGIARKIVFTT